MGFLDGAWDSYRGFVNGLPFVGGMTAGLWGDPSQEAVQEAYKQAQEQQRRDRAYAMQGRMNAMDQGALAFGPRNQMLGEIMGNRNGQPAFDLEPMIRNPMPRMQQEEIRRAAFGDNTSPQGFRRPDRPY